MSGDWDDPEYLVQITAPGRFTAGLVVNNFNDKVIKAAPIVKHMIGWTVPMVEQYCSRKCWKVVNHSNHSREA